MKSGHVHGSGSKVAIDKFNKHIILNKYRGGVGMRIKCTISWSILEDLIGVLIPH